MKKWLLPLLAVCLLIGSCAGAGRFTSGGDGYKFTDSKTGIVYVALSPAFEPAKGGEVLGVCKIKIANTEREVTFRVIPSLESDLWLADEEKNVYYAGQDTPDPAGWTISTVLFCEEDAVCVEQCRLSAGKDDGAIMVLRALYFEGETAERPLETPSLVRRVKLTTEDLPNLYFCFDYYRYEDGRAFFFERYSGRIVEIPSEADALFAVI